MPEQKPWEKYSETSSNTPKPWEKYGDTAAAEAPVAETKPEPSLWDKFKTTADTVLRSPIVGGGPAQADFVENLAKTVAGFPSGIYHAATDPATSEAEKNMAIVPGLTTAKRLLVDPAMEHASQVMPNIQEANKKASEGNLGGAIRSTGLAGAHAAGVVPGVGQVISDPAVQALNGDVAGGLGSLGGNLLIGEGIHAGLNKYGDVMRPTPGPVRKNIQNFSTFMGDDAVHGRAPQEQAKGLHPYWQQVADELGIDPNKIIAGRDTSNKRTDSYGNLYRGMTEVDHKNTLKNDAFYDEEGTNPRPLAIAAFDRLVDISNRPIEDTINKFRGDEVPQVKARIEQNLRARASEYTTLDPALASAYTAMADKVKASSDTVGAIHDLKVHANKESSSLFKKSPAGQAAASANPIIAWKELGDQVRGELYKELEAKGGPNLAKYGQLETDAINAREKVYKDWATAAGDSANEALKSYIQKVAGNSPGRAAVSSGARAAMAGRALLPGYDPLKDFNKKFKNSFGEMRGYQNPGPVVNPQTPGGGHPLVPQGPVNPNAQQPDLKSTGLPNVGLYKDQFHKNPIPNSENRPPVPTQLSSIHEHTPTVSEIMSVNPIPNSEPLHHMTGLENVNQNRPLLPHEIIAKEAAEKNPIPNSAPHNPIPTGLNVAGVGNVVEPPKTPLTHPLMGPLSDMNKQNTPEVKVDKGHNEVNPNLNKNKAPLNVAPTKPAQLQPPPLKVSAAPPFNGGNATSAEVRYAGVSPTQAIKSTGMFEQGVMPGGSLLRLPQEEILRRIGKILTYK